MINNATLVINFEEISTAERFRKRQCDLKLGQSGSFNNASLVEISINMCCVEKVSLPEIATPEITLAPSGFFSGSSPV